MLTIVARNQVKPGKKREFIDTAADLIKKSNEEPGNIEYALYEDENDENVLTFIEVWESGEAIGEHNKSEHFVTTVPKLAELCVGDMGVSIYKKV